jgi:hypothetical protein
MRPTDPEALAVWRSRLRWRLRGAWLWPTFVVAVVVDAAVLARLPFAGGRSDVVGSFLAAGFLNLIVVAAVAPVGGALLARRRPTLPRGVAADRVGTTGMALLLAAFVAGGLAHRGAVVANDADGAAARTAARQLAVRQAPPEYLPLHGEDTWQPGPDLFRTCFAGADPRRDFCVLVRTDEAAPIARRDPDQRPNGTVAGPGNPGRQGA